MFDALSDEELVDQAQAALPGDTRAFEELVRRHRHHVVANCRYLGRSPDDAEDLAQEVFAKAFFSLARFEGRSKFKTWLTRIKINHCLNFLEKGRGRSFVDVESPGLVAREELRTAPSAERDVNTLDERERIALILDELPDTLRLPLVLRDADGYSYQEIADRLGVGLSAVKMRIKRGREAFREAWGELGS